MMPAFCLTLHQTPGREKPAAQHFREAGLPVTMFHGIHAPTMGLTTLKTSDRGGSYIIQQGQVGCTLSHYVLWQSLLTFTDHQQVLILEDDAVLCDGFAWRFNDAMQRAPSGWQFVYVGHCSNVRGRHPTQFSPTKYEAGTHAYAVTRAGLEVLVRTNQEIRTHCDIQVSQNTLPTIGAYKIVPSLVGQRTQRKTPTGAYEWLTTTNSLAHTKPQWDGEIEMPADPMTEALLIRVLRGILPGLAGWMDEIEAIAIIDEVMTRKPEVCVEIGVFQGKGLFTMAAAMRQVGAGKAFGIDAWDCSVAQDGTPDGPNRDWWGGVDLQHFYLTTLEKRGQLKLDDWCEVVRSRSTDPATLAKFVDGSVGLIRLDGNHNVEPYLQDVTAWLPKLAPGCAVFFNDVGWCDGGCTDTTKPAMDYLKANGCTVERMLGNTALMRKP